MSIAGVCLEKKLERKLKSLGVKDSKELSPKKREELYGQIDKIAKDIIVIKVPACKINKYKDEGINLDRIEAMKMADIIRSLDADVFYVDSIRQNSDRFKKMILEYLPEDKKKARLVVENYLDESVTVVGAASIFAKVERDRKIEEIKKEVNFDFGVGYSHDERAIKFLEKVLQEYESPPDDLRIYWDTVEKVATRLFEEDKKVQRWVIEKVLKQDSLQSKIKDFFFKKEEC